MNGAVSRLIKAIKIVPARLGPHKAGRMVSLTRAGPLLHRAR